MTRRLLYCILLLSICIPGSATAASNAGIVEGLWYDRSAVFVDAPVRIYVAIRNNTGADLSGTVEFFVDDVRIERNSIDALDGRIIESWADWIPTAGTSTISATLSRTEVSNAASGTVPIVVTSTLASDTIFVDFDTDGDGIGNLEDTDDDADGLADDEDPAPLLFNEPAAETPPKETSDVRETPDSDNITTNQTSGLEQFLTPSRADTALASLTETITASKKRLDEYRDARTKTEEEPAPGDVSTPTTTEAAHGTIIRSETKSEGWLASTWSVILLIIGTIFTVLLAALSFLLGYPALIQILLLLAIVYSIYRLARRLGSRRL